jgi:hypothetical protein
MYYICGMISTAFKVMGSMGDLQLSIMVTYLEDDDPIVTVIDLTEGGKICELNSDEDIVSI